MSSTKCPHCGLVNFSSEGTCKRCRNVLSASAEALSAHPPAAVIHQRNTKRGSGYTLLAGAITIILLIANGFLAYAVARESTNDISEVMGTTVGGMLAWPIVLLIIYALSKKFREKYSLHAVINYGLGLNTLVLFMMSLR